jgi:hypothetical protein
MNMRFAGVLPVLRYSSFKTKLRRGVAVVVQRLLFGSDVSTRSVASVVKVLFGGFGGTLSKPCCVDGGAECKQPKDASDQHKNCLAVGDNRDGYIRIGGPSLFHQIILLEAVIFGCIGAASAFIRGIPAGKPFQPGWIAIGGVGAIATVWCLLNLC